MPQKLDRCVKKLIKEGHTEEEAWKICKKQIESKYKAQMNFEKMKQILTGQLITKKYLAQKEKEYKKE